MNQQRRAIVIGATSGIGLEVAKALAAQGWLVGIAGRRQERLQQILTIHDIRPGFVRTALISGSNYPLQLDAAKVAQHIVRGLKRGRTIITIDWRYRLLVFFWRLIPRWLWVRLRIA